MNTECVGTGGENIARAVQVLWDGGIVAFPTDTVYGVGTHAFLTSAVERLYDVKRRPRDKAIPLLLPNTAVLPEVAAPIPDLAYALAALFWPGALTLVLRRTERVPDALTAGGDTVAVRVPDHPVPQALLAALDVPLATTSANLSGRPAPITAGGVLAQLRGRIELILDGGGCPGGISSTVLDLTTSPPRILREGGISTEEIRRVIGT